jgi:hypothetical protein
MSKFMPRTVLGRRTEAGYAFMGSDRQTRVADILVLS